jgi:hypothetical protein
MGDRVEQQGGIAAASPQREVVDAQYSRHRRCRDRLRHQLPQDRASRNPSAQPGQHGGTGPAGSDNCQVGDQ